MSEIRNIAGLDKLRHALLELPKAIATKRLRKPVAEAAKMIRDDARIRAPVVTGLLKKDIVFARDTHAHNTLIATYVVVVKHKKGDAYYWSFVEFGTKGSARHHKTQAYPYMRPAFEVNKERALTMIIDGLRDGVELEAAALRWSNAQ